jgi:hypothetical protein
MLKRSRGLSLQRIRRENRYDIIQGISKKSIFPRPSLRLDRATLFFAGVWQFLEIAIKPKNSPKAGQNEDGPKGGVSY